ncbi:MAG: Rpn family recombination-promoting nuclease/putative transposase [Gomphosphaeria aponina SAG 52.96 = DSM 107014]|uniref:Rpn family recombination-promoting nuclease/putative transposase n=1 Tax=Gomphosphaeria aponina SAG 52.96 = DSM 107014 TaxID=1521640 RepID=A0A941GNH6_9CHRO|nr:Rpn family recombination-promoting nuclease/putative transposase [Gomphosphaeria aponina SAG 52.96 = DSM 107014]
MKTDTLFYQLFQTFPELVFELINQPYQEGYEFSSREIKELSRRFDGIFMPKEGIVDQPIYFVEVQFQPKADFYWRFFTEVMIYLGQYQPVNDWMAIAIFAQKSLDPTVPHQYRSFLLNGQLIRVYLDELPEPPPTSLGRGIIKLVVETETKVIEKAPVLMNFARENIANAERQQKILALIETTLLYKLTSLSREEIEAMFSLEDLKKTRYFREYAEQLKKELAPELKQEGKLETVSLLSELGLSVEEIATKLNLDIEAVKKAIDSN